MNKTTSIVITVLLVIGLGIVFFMPSKDDPDSVSNSLQNVEIRDGIQYVSIHARGGYTPRVSSAQAGIPTRLVVTTDGTYDCSAALVIKSIGYQNILPRNGEEVIDLGSPEAGKLQGLCSMGMYGFEIDFI